MNGELVGIVDSDDYIAPDMYGKLYNLMIDNNAEISSCNFYVFNDDSVAKEAKNTGRALEIISGEQALRNIVRP